MQDICVLFIVRIKTEHMDVVYTMYAHKYLHIYKMHTQRVRTE